MKRHLEVCAFNLESCLIAEKVGAFRAELCDNPVEGGTTPSYGMIRQTREKVAIKLYPIIRPRCGNYFYSEEEFAIMLDDIRIAKELGCDGISVGVQLQSGLLDQERMQKIVELAYPMGVTCNRIFDAVPNPVETLEALIDCGCERVLTSGQASAAPDACDLLTALVQQANGRISIMPGAGVRAENIERLMKTGATEFHTSARMPVPDPVIHKNPAVLDIGTVVVSNEMELKKIVALLNG